MNEAHVISADEYKKWEANWAAQAAAPDPYTFFSPDGQVQTGVVFPFDTLRYLFSAVGVETIKVRFGLRQFDGDRPAQFYPMLVGVGATGPDSEVQILTPYFISSTAMYDYSPSNGSEGEGNLPVALMEEWKKNWYEKAKVKAVDAKMFQVNPQLTPDEQGFLRGYSYSVKEMMAALGAFQQEASIHLRFGLHKYYSLLPAPDSPLTEFYTFGLILYSSRAADDSGYYDFSAPCPFTC